MSRPNKQESNYIEQVVNMGCIVCGAPAVYHHARAYGVMGRRAPHCLGFALCPEHHTDGNYGTALHKGQATWEAIYGSEADLINKTILLMVR